MPSRSNKKEVVHIMDSKFNLKIQPQPHRFPFCNQWMDLTIYLIDSKDNMKCGTKVPLNLDLLYASKNLSSSTNSSTTCLKNTILKINSTHKLEINESGICNIQFKITECSKQHGNQKFVLRASPQLKEDEEYDSAYSIEMLVINYRLQINGTLSSPWFKDEGGRENCLELPVELLDNQLNLATKRKIPLRVTLVYENENVVLNQDILKMSPDSHRIIVNGHGFLKVRIEDVSKNHQGQSFRIKIEPDTQESLMYSDVSYDCSDAILVKSKRNRRPKIKERPITNEIGISTSSTKISTTPQSNQTSISTIGSSDILNYTREALEWVNASVRLIQSLEWQTIGCEIGPNGTPDPSRPIYRCAGCWRSSTTRSTSHASDCSVANTLCKYNALTFHKMVEFIESHASTSSQEENSSLSTIESKRKTKQRRLNEMK